MTATNQEFKIGSQNFWLGLGGTGRTSCNLNYPTVLWVIPIVIKGTFYFKTGLGSPTPEVRTLQVSCDRNRVPIRTTGNFTYNLFLTGTASCGPVCRRGQMSHNKPFPEARAPVILQLWAIFAK